MWPHDNYMCMHCNAYTTTSVGRTGVGAGCGGLGRALLAAPAACERLGFYGSQQASWGCSSVSGDLGCHSRTRHEVYALHVRVLCFNENVILVTMALSLSSAVYVS